MPKPKLLYNENQLKNTLAVLATPQGMSQRSKPLTTPDSSVPYGYCHCGCGSKAPRSPKAYIAKGLKKGDPFKYVAGHNGRKSPIHYVEEDRGHSTPCWIWQQGKISTGYGILKDPLTKKRKLAHRYYYEQKRGKLPNGMIPDHLCRVPSCINPDHMEAVTYAVNTQRGLAAKLTLSKVREIRRLHAEEGLNNQQIANRLGVHRNTVRAAVIRQTWKNA